MNGKKRNLISDTEAVSGIIGAILLMAIAVTMFTLFQATVIPDLNRKVEWDHIAVANDDMMLLKSDIRNAGGERTQQTSDIHLGVRYPNRAIFINPAVGVSGSITIDNSPIVTAQGHDYDSSRIIYELHGEPNLPKIVYEHGAIIWDYGDGREGSADMQSLITKDKNIYIPIVHGSATEVSELGVSALTVYPYESVTFDEDISGFSATLDTDYPEVWNDILFSDGVRQELGIGDTEVVVENDQIKIDIGSDVTRNLIRPVQTSTETLHAGLIRFSPEEIYESTGVHYAGEGSGSLTDGSLWDNIPSSIAITQFDLTNIIIDDSIMDDVLDCDCIIIQVTDTDGNWWRAEVNFDWDEVQPKDVHPKITTISVHASGEIEEIKTLNSIFDTSTTIDFLSITDFPNSCYQNAGICPINTLHVEIAEDPAGQSQEGIAIKWFNLIMAGS